MILLKIFNLICVGLILSTSIVDGKGKISLGRKPSSSRSSGLSSSSKSSSSSGSYGWSKPFTSYGSSLPSSHGKTLISRPVDMSRYQTHPAHNKFYKPETRYPSNTQNNPSQYYPYQMHHNYQGWGNQPQKSNVGRIIATQAIAGLGGTYIGHQIAKHNSWYDKRRAEREQDRKREREREHERDRQQEYSGTYIHGGSYNSGGYNSGIKYSSNGTYIAGKSRDRLSLDKLKPITPFKVNDISNDFNAQKYSAGNGLIMRSHIHNWYNSDPQKNEISKAADSNIYLNMKLRPSKSETIPQKYYTTEQLQRMMRGILDAVTKGPVLPGLVISKSFNQTGDGLQPSSNASMTIDSNLQNPQVLPLVMKQLETDENMERKIFPNRNTSGSSSMHTIPNALILISIVTFKKF